MINSLVEKVLGLTEKLEKPSSLLERQEQHFRRNCMLIHDVVESSCKSSYTDPGDINCQHRIDL